VQLALDLSDSLATYAGCNTRGAATVSSSYSLLPSHIIFYLGRHRDLDASTKETTPRSSAGSAPRKRKARLSIDARTAGTIGQSDNEAGPSTRTRGKRSRTSASTSSNQVFEGVVISKPPPRTSRVAETNSNMDLGDVYRRLADEHSALAKTYKKLADLMD
jgi:hypothetical protein